MSDNQELINMLRTMGLEDRRVSKEPKVADPQHFNGTSKDLPNFITQCRMYITLQPSRFPDDKMKVIFMCSYMRGAAFSWVQPHLDNLDTPEEEAFLVNFPLFLQALRDAFGDPDQKKAAEFEISSLHQGEQPASTYAAKFQRLAPVTEWNDAALRFVFTKGLSDRLQDELATRDLPDRFTEYIHKVIELDNRIRERKQSRKGKHPTRPHQTPPHHPVKITPDDGGVRPMEVDKTVVKKGFKKPLTKEERQRRADNGLCMYCGGAGHAIGECPLRKKGYQAAKVSVVKQGNMKVVNKSKKAKKLIVGAIHNGKPLTHMCHQEPDTPLLLDITLKSNKKKITTVGQIDCGAMASFIDYDFVKIHGIRMVKKESPVQIFVVDGTPATHNWVTHEAKVTMIVQHHRESITLNVTKLGDSPVLLGLPWLKIHNPTINWTKHQINFGSDYCSKTCHSKNSFNHPNSNKQVVVGAQYLHMPSNHQNAADWQSSSTHPKIPSKYKDYFGAFNEEDANTLPDHKSSDHHIPLVEGSQPSFGPIYSLSREELTELSNYITANLRNGFIRQSTSPAGAPIMFVKKKDGSLRLCVDYRGLNKITIKNRYPLPLINEMIDRLSSSSIFTKLDIRNAYHRVRIAKGDEWKTAFRTRYGHFEYLVMPFGLTNAPASFQALINNVLREFLDICVVVYLDDILVFSANQEEHDRHVKKVLGCLQDAGLYVKAEKCEFDKPEVEFLGFRIGKAGISMDPTKVKTITDWPPPKTVHDVQVFLGFANFYRRFIRSYSKLTTPITNLLKKDTKFNWSEQTQQVFKKLKETFTSAPILQLFNPDLPCTIETDASDFAIAGVINQTGEDGILHPIAFYSRKMLPAEVNYDVYDKEMLAIIDSFKQWRHYLEGAVHQTIVLTDHRNLEYFMTAKKLNRRQARWAIELSTFNFVIQYRPGTKNTKADALSRRSDLAFQGGDTTDKQPIKAILRPDQFVVAATATTMITVNPDQDLRDEIKRQADHDAKYKEIVDTIPNDSSMETKGYRIDNDGLVLYQDRVYLPDDDHLKLRIMEHHHDSPMAGHYGRAKTMDLVSRNYFFPGMRKYINRYIANCPTCIRGKPSRQAPAGHLRSLDIPDKPWSSISMDFIVGLPVSNGYDCIWVVVDRFTKMSHFVPCNDTITAEGLASLFITHIFRLHGLPKDIVSDRGALFTSKFWQELTRRLHIKTNLSTAFHPQSDGQTERINSTLEQYLRMYTNYQQDDWCELLPLAEFSYNNAVQSSTQCSPFYANQGNHPRSNFTPVVNQDESVPAVGTLVRNIDSIQEFLKEELKSAQQQQQHYYNQHHRPTPEYQVGSQVYLSTKNHKTKRPCTKLDHKKIGPFKIVARVGSHAYKLDLPASIQIHPVVHASMLTPATNDKLQDIPGRIIEPPPPVEIEGEEEWIVREVLDSRRRRGKLFYLVAWEGYPNPADNSWEPSHHLKNAADKVKLYHQKYPNKPASCK
ncbi:hypothetical protein [Absidia glauca]|uniref:RNA-directed DNA polymerase n=1 Tax=Absidia glauca TaxID=4829 RepID=A0A163JWX2_ABSGL|nr:hypothetical protein [Absidia glauca]